MTFQKTPQQAAAQRIALWRKDPAQFVFDVFKVKPEAWQAEAMRALVTHDRVAIRSGHGVGKSTMLAWTMFWWLSTRFPAKIACTAPTAHQLDDILWGELAKWHRKMPEALKAQFNIKTQALELTADPRSAFAVARTARKEKPEAFQGFHSDNMLFIGDEASGIEDIIFEVGKGSMTTKGAKTLLTGNPTRPSGYFYRVFHSMREGWFTKRVSCYDSTQVRKEYSEEVAKEHGKDSNVYRIRVLGEFPKEEDDVVIPLHLVEAAVQRTIDPDLNTYLPVWGVDVARFGDDKSALAKRCGSVLLEPIKTWQGKSNTQLAGILVDEFKLTPDSLKPSEILIDVIGVGAGVVDICYEMGLPVRGINVAESPAIKDRFSRLRDELWWKARDWFSTLNVSILDDPELIAELTAPKARYLSTGKLLVEPKIETKKRLLKSPDKADSFVLTFAGGLERVIEHRDTRYERKKHDTRYYGWMAA